LPQILYRGTAEENVLRLCSAFILGISVSKRNLINILALSAVTPSGLLSEAPLMLGCGEYSDACYKCTNHCSCLQAGTRRSYFQATMKSRNAIDFVEFQKQLIK
jgi:hypothetical protein